MPPRGPPREEYPFRLVTGRTLYHFHTRTKTARVPQLQNAAPDAWVELHPPDAERLGIAEGDVARVESPRGAVEVRARLSGIRPGVVFVPFHPGYFDRTDGAGPDGGPEGRPRAANEMTITQWDPVSKQPIFKTAAATVTKVADADGHHAPAPTNTASVPTADGRVPATTGGRGAEATSVAGGPDDRPMGEG